MNATTLFPMPPVTNPRPRPTDADALKTVMLELAKNLMEWNDVDGPIEEVAEHLEKAYNRCWQHDGYHLAKELDNSFGWDCDSQMVDTLDMASHLVSSEVQRLTKEWVITNEIKPACAVGDVVTAKWGGNKIIGTVKEVLPDATYTLTVEGRVNSWPIVKWEDAHCVSDRSGTPQRSEEYSEERGPEGETPKKKKP